MSRRVAGSALVAYLAVVAAVTMGPSPGAVFTWAARTANRVVGLAWVSVGDVELSANVLLFAPLGLLLSFALPASSRWLVWTLCVAVSASIETAQLVLPGRQSTVVDVAANAAGAAIGLLVRQLTRRTAARTPSRPPAHLDVQAKQGGCAGGE